MICEHGGEMYAVGSPSGHLYRYDGGLTWTDLGQIGSAAICRAMVSFGGELWLATNTTVAADGTSKVYSYDGATFTDHGNPGTHIVEALGVYDGDLYAGSDLLYKYTAPNTWADLGMPASSYPEPLIEYDGKLYTVRTTAGPDTELYSWDGASLVMEAAIPGAAWVDAFAELNSLLYMGAGDSGLIYTWDGVTLSLVATISEHVDGMAVWSGILFAGTWDNASLYATLDGTNFTKSGEFVTGSAVYELAVAGGRVFAGVTDGHVYFYEPGRPMWQASPLGQMGRHFVVGV